MSFYYSLMVSAEWETRGAAPFTQETIAYLLGASSTPPPAWPDDPHFATADGREPLFPVSATQRWPHAVAQLVPLRLDGPEPADWRLILHTQGNDMPAFCRCLDLLAWLAQFVHADGPIGMFFSPDLPDTPPHLLWVQSGQLFEGPEPGQLHAIRQA